jgi:hypothetical protein
MTIENLEDQIDSLREAINTLETILAYIKNPTANGYAEVQDVISYLDDAPISDSLNDLAYRLGDKILY